jgi:3-hydroxyacyl-[acyl-carrier-protein] dehydratase
VLLIEAAAQVAGIVAQCDPKVPALRDLKLTALKGIKISGTAQPGETIRMEARIAGRLANLIQAEISVWVGKRVVAEGSLTLSGEV